MNTDLSPAYMTEELLHHPQVYMRGLPSQIFIAKWKNPNGDQERTAIGIFSFLFLFLI